MKKKLLKITGYHAAFAKKYSFEYGSQCDIAIYASGHFVRASMVASPGGDEQFACNAIGPLN